MTDVSRPPEYASTMRRTGAAMARSPSTAVWGEPAARDSSGRGHAPITQATEPKNALTRVNSVAHVARTAARAARRLDPLDGGRGTGGQPADRRGRAARHGDGRGRGRRVARAPASRSARM